MLGRKVILHPDAPATSQKERPATPDEILAGMTHGDVISKRDATSSEIRRALRKGLPEHYLGQEQETRRKQKSDGGIRGWLK